MPTLDTRRLHTVQVIPMTAYDARGELDLAPMCVLTERLLAGGLTVFLPCAGSGEFHSLSPDEIIAAVEMTRGVVGDRAVVIAPVGQQVRTAVELGKRSVQAGADAVLVMPLAFPYLSDAGARDYYQAILDGVGCPVLAYKKAAIPTDALLLELAEHPNMAGVKYAENDIDAFTRIVQDDGGRIDWFCGSAERFAPFFMLAGAKGYTTGAGNLCPRLTLAMHAAVVRGDWSEAMRLLSIIRPIEDYRARDGNSFNISMLKHGLRQFDLDFGPPRPPGRKLTAEEMQEIDAMLRPILAAEERLM